MRASSCQWEGGKELAYSLQNKEHKMADVFTAINEVERNHETLNESLQRQKSHASDSSAGSDVGCQTDISEGSTSASEAPLLTPPTSPSSSPTSSLFPRTSSSATSTGQPQPHYF